MQLLFDYADDGNRLIEIGDGQPRPRSVHFDYDALGRLASVTNRVGAVTRYTYVGETHLLHEVVDARNNIQIATEYNADGTAARQWTVPGLQEGASPRSATGR